ncbi:MAG: acyl-CoA carboxylase subunit epsilon [Ornithinimicrobium sp.]|uniref:acyl-CoA carboxylase subunit epsilon n=1 Tax=Ornithinimicrobium sp. TaxID=1977084 RepID=UPI0026DEF644|nr:acyl-CoA carboxylase subunit epsilon [Ornithinimicrobium sp.]MDO5740857.1 acyl-CoA carboxylase subunit epsilon [Ornithinimicrobium sp.]
MSDEAPMLVPTPVLRVVRGNPSAAQLAALTVVLSAAGGGEVSGDGPRRRTLWTAKSRYARPRPAVGPGGWRASALPR